MFHYYQVYSMQIENMRNFTIFNSDFLIGNKNPQ